MSQHGPAIGTTSLCVPGICRRARVDRRHIGLLCEGCITNQVMLLQAVDEVVAEAIYLQVSIDLNGTVLINDCRELLARQSVNLTRLSVANYPALADKAREQVGEPSIYPWRQAKDNEPEPRESV